MDSKRTFPITHAIGGVIGRFFTSRQLCRVVLIALCQLFLWIALLEAKAHVFETQANAFLKDLASFHLHASPASEADVFATKYRKYLRSQKDDKGTRSYEFALGHWYPAFVDWQVKWSHVELLFRAFQRFGMRPAFLASTVRVRNGVIVGVDLHASVAYESDGWWFSTLARVRTRAAIVDRGTTRFHPNFTSGKPGGCTSCDDLWVEMTPRVSPEELRRILRLNMGCISSLQTCTRSEELTPEMGRQLFADRDRYIASRGTTCDASDARRFGRDAYVISVITIDIVTSPDEHGYSSATVAREVPLKGNPSRFSQFFFYPDWANQRELVRPGARLIFFAADLSAEPCGVIAANEANLTAVQQGIEDEEWGQQ